MASAANSAGTPKHPRNVKRSTAASTTAAVAIPLTVLAQPSTVMTKPMRMRAVQGSMFQMIRGVSMVEILTITPVIASAPCAVVQKSVGVGGAIVSHTIPNGRTHVDLTVPLRKKLESTNR